ncbi:MAG: methyltransferase [Acidimicrobiales bacterium]|nr:methyltransferase [Acidimicrobiales bacterium]
MGHYFDDDVATESRRRAVVLAVPGLSTSLVTDRGVFSPDQVDRGTRYLLRTGPHPAYSNTDIVDIGAGYGPITCALATWNPQATIWAVEVNERARELCLLNASNLNLSNVKVVAPDEVPDGLLVDRIWSNPPIRIGKPALHELLSSWLNRLRPWGSAHLVVHKNLGSDSLHRWLEGQGFVVVRRGSEGGYRILDVTHSDPDAVNEAQKQ